MIRSRAFLALAILAALTFPASGQDQLQHKPGVVLSLRGLGTPPPTVLARPRHFAPITVVLENDGPADVEGLLRVYRSQEVAAGVAFSSVPEQGLFYERNVKVARGGKRVEELYYYCQDREPDRICVTLETATGDTIVAAPHPKLDLRTGDVLALSVTNAPDQDDDTILLGGGTIPGPRRPYELAVKHGDPASLPERAEGYGAFDLVILSDVDAVSLSPAQVRALTDWVELGGDLLVAFSGKPGETLSAVGDAVLPVVAAAGEAVRTQDLHALEPLVPDASPLERIQTAVRRVIAKPGARILAGSAEQPLIVRGTHGAGRVTYFAFPIAGLKSCWGTDRGSGGKTILALAAHAPYEDLEDGAPPPPAPPLEEVLLDLTEAFKNLEPPSALIVAPLLVLYVTLVAPLNYLLLNRIGKRDLAMASAAVIAVVFGAIFYGIGWYVHGSGSLVARAAIVELPAGPEGRARIDTMTGFFSTDRGVLDAKATKGSQVAPIAERTTGRGGSVLEPKGADVALKALELDTWSLRRFRATRLEALGALAADLHFEGPNVVGTIENRTKLLLENPVVIVGRRALVLQDMQPGSTVSVNAVPSVVGPGSFELEARLMRSPDRDRNNEDFKKAFRPRYGDASGYGSGPDPFQNDAAARLRAALERRAAGENPGPGAVPALFAACVEQDMGGVDLDVNAKLELARALVLSEVPIVANGPGVAFRDLDPHVRRARGYDAVSGMTGSPARLALTSSSNESAAVTFEWRLPASRELPLVARRLEVAWNLQSDPEKDQVVLSFWDWSQGIWRQMRRVDRAEGSEKFERADSMRRYVEPESGLVRVQLESEQQEILLKDVTLSVTGTREAPPPSPH